MRQFPKELLPITEKDIIKEVAEELGYTEIQVTDGLLLRLLIILIIMKMQWL